MRVNVLRFLKPSIYSLTLTSLSFGTQTTDLNSLIANIRYAKPTPDGVQLSTNPSVKFNEEFFNSEIKEYSIYQSPQGGFRIKSNEESGVIFHLTEINNRLHGILLDTNKNIGYTFSQDPEDSDLQLTPTPKNEIIHICGSDEAHKIYQQPKVTTATPAPAPIVNSPEVLSLESNPGASHVLYLDFNGESDLPGWDGFHYAATAMQVPDSVIHKIWVSMVEDFTPFDVNITTNRDVL